MSNDDTVGTDNTQSTKDPISHLLAPTYAKVILHPNKAHTPAPSTPVHASAANVPSPSTTPVYGPLPSPHSPLMADAKNLVTMKIVSRLICICLQWTRSLALSPHL